MAIKYKITKAAFDKLSDDMKEHYEATDDGKHYTLDVSGLPEPEDAGELKRALDRVRDDLKDAEKERDDLQTKLEAAEKAGGDGAKDVTRLTKRYEDKLATAKTEADAKVDALKGQITKLLKGGKAAALAAEVSTAPDLLKDHIEKRMTVEFPEDGGEPVLKFLTKDGKAAAADFTLDKLKQEVIADPAYKSIIVASKAKGGGAPPASSTGFTPSSGTGGGDQPVPLTKMDNKSFTDTIRERVAAKQAGA